MASRSTPPKYPARIGRYEVARELGVGAMGRVLLARDPMLERHVAVKLLRNDLGIGSEVRDGLLVRMRHEARAAARVTHPNLVVLHDMGEDEELGLYLVFEYLEGPTLKERIKEGRLTARQCARISRELGSALAYAHERGVLHRDVKPENIILTSHGAKLTDFGIARVPDSTLTHGGGLLGTPAYSAPETFREGKFSPQSDQFSMAATLYEAIRGERAFPGDDAVSVASKIANEPSTPFAQMFQYPPALDDVLSRALSKTASERFASCRDLGVALMGALLENPSAGRSMPLDGAAELERSGDVLALLSPRPSGAFAANSEPPARRRSPVQIFLFGALALGLLGLFARAVLRESTEGDASTAGSASATAEERHEPSAEPAQPSHPASRPNTRPANPPTTIEPPPSSSASALSSARPAVSAEPQTSAVPLSSASVPPPSAPSATAKPAIPPSPSPAKP